MEKTGVIIVAGGSGKRCGGGLPKQFRLLGDRPLLARTIDLCAEALPGARIVVVLPAQYVAFWKNFAARFDMAPHTVAEGGAERFHSVRRGLAALAGDEELIAVHDAVRPLATPGMIRRVVRAAAEYGAAIPVTEPVDSFRALDVPNGDGGPSDFRGDGTKYDSNALSEKEAHPPLATFGTKPADEKSGSTNVAEHAVFNGARGCGVASHIVDRRFLRIVQTPQAFRAELLRAAYEAPYEERFTDDASVVERAGHPVFLTEGERTNLKITTSDDFALAGAILAARKAEAQAQAQTEAETETETETESLTEAETDVETEKADGTAEERDADRI